MFEYVLNLRSYPANRRGCVRGRHLWHRPGPLCQCTPWRRRARCSGSGRAGRIGGGCLAAMVAIYDVMKFCMWRQRTDTPLILLRRQPQNPHMPYAQSGYSVFHNGDFWLSYYLHLPFYPKVKVNINWYSINLDLQSRAELISKKWESLILDS